MRRIVLSLSFWGHFDGAKSLLEIALFLDLAEDMNSKLVVESKSSFWLP